MVGWFGVFVAAFASRCFFSMLLKITSKSLRLRILHQHCSSIHVNINKATNYSWRERKRIFNVLFIFWFYLPLTPFILRYFVLFLICGLFISLHFCVIYFNIFQFHVICIHLGAYNCGSTPLNWRSSQLNKSLLIPGIRFDSSVFTFCI